MTTDPIDPTESNTVKASLKDASFRKLLEDLSGKDSELKEKKREIKDLEADVPMDLEELLITLKDLKVQVAEKRAEFLRELLEKNPEYSELRSDIQNLKEESALLKLEIFTQAANQSRDRGNLDEVVNVQGMPFRIQTQSEVAVYLNGKELK